MSAFGGICLWDGQPVQADRLSRLAEHLRVAGPDRSATVQPAAWVALQSHLLYFDQLSMHERQPYVCGSNIVLSWDGRLDNRDDLRLCLHRYLRDDQSDAALVAAAYEHWGLDALRRLIGDWALAIWDHQYQRVLLARDYMGNRPLYYLAQENRLVWATRIEALAGCEDLFGQPDDAFIAEYVASGSARGLAPFKGALPVVAGHVFIGTRDGVTVERYWKYAPTTLRYRNLEQYDEHMRMLVTDAVRVRLRASGTVWAHLSGGWDSSTIVCLAHRLVAKRQVEAEAIQPLSIVADDPEAAEEREFMASVEQWCGLETKTVPFLGRPTFADMLGCPVPMNPTEGFGMEAPIQAASGRIVLTGALGDTAMGQGEPLLAMWEGLSARHPFLSAAHVLAFARVTKQSLAALFIRALRRRFGLSLPARIDEGMNVRGIRPEALAVLKARHRVTPPSTAEFDPLYRALVDSLYQCADEATLANSETCIPVVWKVHPYSHRPLIEFVLAIPHLVLFEPRFKRAGMKRAFADVLPPKILERTTKVGINRTVLIRSRRRKAELMIDASPLTDPLAHWRVVERGVIDSEVLKQDIHGIRTGRPPSNFLKRCLDIEAWLRSLPNSSSEVLSQVMRVRNSNDLATKMHSTAVNSRGEHHRSVVAISDERR